MSRNEFFEWNDPFTGYESDADLLRQLRMEYENDALHDQWKTRLQKRTTMGTHKEEESCQGPCTTQCCESAGRRKEGCKAYFDCG